MVIALIALAAMVLIMHYPIYVLFNKYKALEERHEALRDYVFGEVRHGSMLYREITERLRKLERKAHYREVTERLKKLESEGEENVVTDSM